MHRSAIIGRLAPLRRGLYVSHVSHFARRNAGLSPPRAAYNEYYATCHPGLEEVVATELSSSAIGAQSVQVGKAGVSFSGPSAVLYRANLALRSAIRVLTLLHEVDLDPDLPAGDTIYEAFRSAADWPALLPPGQCFSVESRIFGNTSFTNSHLLSLRARDAICDTIRDRRGTKPQPPEPGRPADLPLFATAFQNTLRIYRDASGQSLHRRGYRQAMHAASLNEAAAAGCLSLAGFPELLERGQGVVLADPMCGSGTFLIEAALMATHTAPGLFRRAWPFQVWPDFEPQSWRDAVEAAREARRAPPPGSLLLFGNDRHAGALSLAARDIQAAGVEKLIRLHHGEARAWELPKTPQMVITNPPWGLRLMGGGRGGREEREDRGGRGRGGRGREERSGGRGRGWEREDRGRRGGYEEGEDGEDLEEAWSALGAFLKAQAPGANAYVLSGSTKATQHLRLRADRRIPVTVGGVDCRLLHYTILPPRGENAAPEWTPTR